MANLGGQLLYRVTTVFFFVCGCSTAADPAHDITTIQQGALVETRPVAESAVATLRMLAAGDGYKVLGFSDAKQVEQARLGAPIPVFRVSESKILAYKRGVDPATLFTECDRVVYPVLVGDQIKSAIAIFRTTDHKWLAGEFGRPGTASYLSSAIKSVGDSSYNAGFVAEIPSQLIYLKGQFGAGRLQQLNVVIIGPDTSPGGGRFPIPAANNPLQLLDDLANTARSQSKIPGVR